MATRLTTRLRASVLVAAMLSLVGIMTAAGPANAAPAQPAAASGFDNLYFCDYDIAFDNIAVWAFPGGADRSGNRAFTRVLKGIAFNSIPWISSGTVNGQRWIYGAALIPDSVGRLVPMYGWVGKGYLSPPRCDTAGFQTSNQKIAGTHQGDDFVSNPNTVSPSFRGQTWVWGSDPFAANRPGWVGRTWLTLNSCSGGQCFYKINGPNINMWILPGGGSGP
jgi:hypothetical protein